MTDHDHESTATHERIDSFLSLLGEVRLTSPPEEFALLVSGYRAEVERLQREVLAYLEGHAGDSNPLANPSASFALAERQAS